MALDLFRFNFSQCFQVRNDDRAPEYDCTAHRNTWLSVFSTLASLGSIHSSLHPWFPENQSLALLIRHGVLAVKYSELFLAIKFLVLLLLCDLRICWSPSGLLGTIHGRSCAISQQSRWSRQQAWLLYNRGTWLVSPGFCLRSVHPWPQSREGSSLQWIYGHGLPAMYQSGRLQGCNLLCLNVFSRRVF